MNYLQKLCTLLLILSTITLSADLGKVDLDNLKLENLRENRYFSLLLTEDIDLDNKKIDISYLSESNKVFARIKIPKTPQPKKGYPVVVIAHDKVGASEARDWEFEEDNKSLTGQLISRYLAKGYMVVIPGFRGHGTIKDNEADGIKYLYQLDNESDLITNYYAKDLVNLILGLTFIKDIRVGDVKKRYKSILKMNLKEINLVGVGQGADVVMIALGIIDGNKGIKVSPLKASLWLTESISFEGYRKLWDIEGISSSINIRKNLKDYKNELNRVSTYSTIRERSIDKVSDKNLSKDKIRELIRRIGRYAAFSYIDTPMTIHYPIEDNLSKLWGLALKRYLSVRSKRIYLFGYDKEELSKVGLGVDIDDLFFKDEIY